MTKLEDTEEADESPRMRKMFCSLGEISRADGSVIMAQGGTSVGCGVYGPGEIRGRQTGEVVDRAAVEVIMRPRTGLPQVEDRAREARIVSTVTASVLTILHPRTIFSVNLQEMQDDGCLESACINASCLALLDASVSLKFLIASVTVIVMKDTGDIVTDPTLKQIRSGSSALLTFVFSNRSESEEEPSIVSAYSEGRVSPVKLQECLRAAHVSKKMELNHSFAPSYFSIDDILATQERVPCQIESDLPNLGFLDPGSDSANLARGTKLELPLWMIEGLTANQARNYVNVDVPKTFKEVFREIMSADPLVVDLHKLGPYYYEFARHLMKLTAAEGEAIGDSIRGTFKTRFREIMDASQNASEVDTVKVTNKMDELERLLYREGQRTKRGMEDWLHRRTGRIETSAMVAAMNKRRKVDYS